MARTEALQLYKTSILITWVSIAYEWASWLSGLHGFILNLLNVPLETQPTVIIYASWKQYKHKTILPLALWLKLSLMLQIDAL